MSLKSKRKERKEKRQEKKTQKKAAKQAKKEQKQALKTAKKEAKIAKKNAKANKIQAKADAKIIRAEAKKTKADAKMVLAEQGISDGNSVGGVFQSIGSAVGGIFGGGSSGEEYYDDSYVPDSVASGQTPFVGADVHAPRRDSDSNKDNTIKYVGIGGGVLAFIVILLVAFKRK